MAEFSISFEGANNLRPAHNTFNVNSKCCNILTKQLRTPVVIFMMI